MFPQSACTRKQENQSEHVQDCGHKDEDEVMFHQPVIASTPQEGHQHHVYEQHFPDDGDHEIVFKGFDLMDF